MEDLGMGTFLLIGHAWRKSVMKINVLAQHSLDLCGMAQTVCQCSSLVTVQEGSGGQMQQREWPSYQVLLIERSQNLCQEIIGEKNHWGKRIVQAPSFLQHITTVIVMFMIQI